jgi:protein phosphatase
MEARRRGVKAVLDLTAEFSEAPAFLGLVYQNIQILDLTGLNAAQLQKSVGFISEHEKKGIVYVHCKVGYSRTAAAAGAYLLASGQAITAGEAVALLRAARPSIVIRPESHSALVEFKVT